MYNYIIITLYSFTIILQLPRIHLQLYYNYPIFIYNYITMPLYIITMLSLKVVVLYTLQMRICPRYCDKNGSH
jgi:hypothetical protein